MRIFRGIPNVSWLTEYQTHTITKKCYELRAASPFRVGSERVSERRSCGGRGTQRALIFFPCTLLLHLISLVTSIRELARRLLRFSFFVEMVALSS